MIVSIRRGTLVVVLSILIIGVLSSMCMAMPNQVKVTKANGQIVLYSINDAISNPTMLALMNTDMGSAFENGRPMVGILYNGKILDLQLALQFSGGYQSFENQVKDGTQAEATDLVATIDWEGTPIGPIGDDEFKVLSIE